MEVNEDKPLLKIEADPKVAQTLGNSSRKRWKTLKSSRITVYIIINFDQMIASYP